MEWKKIKYGFLAPTRRGSHTITLSTTNKIPAGEMTAQSFLIRTTLKANSEADHWEFTSTLLVLGTHSNIPSQKALRQVWHSRKSGCPRIIFGLSLWAVRSVALSLMRNKFSLHSASTPVTCSHAELQLFSQYLVSCLIEFLFPSGEGSTFLQEHAQIRI